MSRSLERVLGLPQLIYIVLGTVIGSGIFLLPGVILRQSGGHVDLALGVWAGAGVLSFLGALTYAELGAMQPESGGVYVYLRDAFGPLSAFLFGWTFFLVVASGSVATLAVASTVYLGEIIPMSSVTARVVAICIIVLLAAVNIRGTRTSARVEDWTTALKVIAILGMVVALFWSPRSTRPAVAVQPATLGGLGIATVSALWAFEGWAYVTFSAGETRDPQRTFPRGIAIGTGALVAIYILANLAYLAVLGSAGVAASDKPASDAMRIAFGPATGRVVAAIILISVFSATNSIFLTAPRVFFAMARDRIFFQRLADIHPRFGTPALAIGAMALWSMLLAASGTYEQLLTYVVFTAWIFYGLGALTVFTYRRTRPTATRPFRVPGYPWTPALFVLAAFAIVANTIVAQPLRAAAGLAVVALGTPAYVIWRARAARSAPRPD